MIQYGMWLLRPRSLREFRGHVTQRTERTEGFFLAMVECVDRVYRNDTLRSFWRTGRLVPNRAHGHPYQQGIPQEYARHDRWFLLDSDADPPRPWTLQTRLPVFSLALAQGEGPRRRWLLYTHSPLEDRKGVRVTLPDFGPVTVDAPVAGAFYVVDEQDRSARALDVGGELPSTQPAGAILRPGAPNDALPTRGKG